MLTRMKMDILTHVRLNFILYLILLFALLTGIAAGAFTAGAMSDSQRLGLSGYLEVFFHSISIQSIDRGAIFWEAVWQQLQITFFIWLSGIFIFGFPFILFFAGLRGFFIGFTVGFLVSQYRFGGFLFTLLCILPQGLLYIPSIIGVGVLALEYSMNRFKNRKVSYSREQRMKTLTPYTIKILLLFGIMVLAGLFEAYVTPVFFGLFRSVF